MLRLFIVCTAAGIAAGVGTGFAGLSAATVIAPMLISFLGYPWYESVGIGLASDVLASAFSAYIYKKNGNIDLKNGAVMVAAVLLMVILGSYFSQYLPDVGMSYLSVAFTAFLGIRFIFKPAMKSNAFIAGFGIKKRRILSVVCGVFIGFYCGFLGLGGGMMMLFILTTILGYDLKTAVGTSVFVMTFIAFTGAASHFYFGEVAGFIPALLICMAFTLAGAVTTSAMSNKMKDKNTNRVTGAVLLVMSIVMLWEMFL